jgi:hypothetical protein
MPVDIDAVGAAGGYRLPAGTYTKLLRKQCEIKYVHSNPRCNVLVDDWRAALVECDKARELAAVKAAEMYAELLTAGGPVAVPAWQARCRSMPGMPAWLKTASIHGGAVDVWVYPDDTVEPAGFCGERRADGGFEHIRVQPRQRPLASIRRDRPAATDR